MGQKQGQYGNMLGLLLVTAGISAVIYYVLFHRNIKLPPGPRGIPFLGHVLQFDAAGPHHTLMQWVKEFGDIYRIKIFGKNVIVLSGAEQIRDAMVKYSDAFAGRPSFHCQGYVYKGDELITTYHGPRTMEQKKFVMNSMKIYGEGLCHLEAVVQDVLEEVMSFLTSQNDKPFEPSDILFKATNDVISLVVYGSRLSKDMQAEFKQFEIDSQECFSPEGYGVELEVFPWLMYLPNKNKDRLKKVRASYIKIANTMMAEKKMQFDSDNPTCLLDNLWKLQPSAVDTAGMPLFPDNSIRAMTYDNMVAGTTTTYSTLLGFLVICINYPDLQPRLQAQIDKVIGERRPKLSDRSSLPLVEATILETLRYLSQVPFMIPHMTTTDVNFHGYNIPRHTEVWMNAWSLHHDERYWEEPWSFKPERFLDEQGQLLPPEHPIRRRFVLFGAGRRVCLGEVLAKSRLFLFISSLLQQFTFQLPEGVPLPVCDPRKFKLSLVMRPDMFEIRAVQRKHTMKHI